MSASFSEGGDQTLTSHSRKRGKAKVLGTRASGQICSRRCVHEELALRRATCDSELATALQCRPSEATKRATTGTVHRPARETLGIDLRVVLGSARLDETMR